MAEYKPIVNKSGTQSEITSPDIIAAESLGTGTADDTTYLRGDGTWQTVSGVGPDIYAFAAAYG